MSCGRPLSVGMETGSGAPERTLDAVRLDQRVQDEGAAGLPLAVQAVAAMHEHRRGGEPVADRAAGAAAFQDRAFSARAFRGASSGCVLDSRAFVPPGDCLYIAPR